MMANNGEWLITVIDAAVIKGFDLFSKSDLYIQLKAGGKVFKTKTCHNADSPQWNESFSFPMDNYASDIEIKVLDNDFFKDDKIAVALIPFKQFPNNFGEEKEYSIPLSYDNKDVGILHLRVKNNTNQQIHSNYDNTMDNKAHIVEGNYSNNSGYNTPVLGGHSHGQPNNNNLNNLNNLNNNNNNNNETIIKEQHYEQNQNIMPQQDNQTYVDPNNIAIVEPPIVNKKIKDKSSKIHKHKHHEDAKVVLPEKHHHYQDGYTSSSSESSNEGEKQRARDGNLGDHAYDLPLQNNEPYINNTVPPTHPNHYYPADKDLINTTDHNLHNNNSSTFNHNNNNNNTNMYDNNVHNNNPNHNLNNDNISHH